jgi:two-component system, CitB family, response regulator DctR
MSETIRVLLVEDDLMVQEINKSFIERVEGFKVVGVAKNGYEALEKINQLRPHLALLDLYMPGMDGLETLRIIRRDDYDIDVIAVTAANDRETVMRVMRLGAVDYVFKPFQFERIKQALLRYQSNFQRNKLETFSQPQFDQSKPLEQEKKEEHDIHYPKGIQAFTLRQVSDFLRHTEKEISAEELGQQIGMSRVTVRRYLEYLETVGQAKSLMVYGTIGRPMKVYTWVNEQKEQNVK